MSKRFRAWRLDETLLFPPSVQDLVPADHVSRLVVDLARESLDLQAIYAAYRGNRGQPPYDPAMMVALLPYSHAVGIRLRDDHDASDLRRLARASKNANQTRRLLALAAIHDGCSRSEAADIGGVGLQIIRDRVLRFNAQGADGLIDRKAPGNRPRLNDAQRAALAAAVEAGPTPYLDGVVRWRQVDLVQWLQQEFGVSVSRQTIGRELAALGFRKLTARPQHHAQDPAAQEDFKKVSRKSWRRSGNASRKARR